jgi:uncharacterized integral membrane protein (TIGR00698 family)
MEGIPEWAPPEEPAGASLVPGALRRAARHGLERAGDVLPGLALGLLLAGIGEVVSAGLGRWLFGTAQSPISPILAAIVAGLLLRNTVGLPALYDPGLILALRRLLRIGVALLGVRLSVAAVGSVGVLAIPVVVVSIATALAVVTCVARALGVSPRMGGLIAVGTAICGNTAIVAAGPVIGAERSEMSYAVGAITLFGLIALLVYPFLAHALFGGDPTLAGLFLGTAIHDTAQVAGAGLMYEQQFGDAAALETAAVTKLLRNLFMLGVIPLLAVMYRRTSGADGGARRGGAQASLGQAVPWFVVGFLVMALVRTGGDLAAGGDDAWLAADVWAGALHAISLGSTWCLAVAMAAVGLGTDVGRLQALGWRPLVVGLVAALAVGVASASALYTLRALGAV